MVPGHCSKIPRDRQTLGLPQLLLFLTRLGWEGSDESQETKGTNDLAHVATS